MRESGSVYATHVAKDWKSVALALASGLIFMTGFAVEAPARVVPRSVRVHGDGADGSLVRVGSVAWLRRLGFVGLASSAWPRRQVCEHAWLS